MLPSRQRPVARSSGQPLQPLGALAPLLPPSRPTPTIPTPLYSSSPSLEFDIGRLKVCGGEEVVNSLVEAVLIVDLLVLDVGATDFVLILLLLPS